MDEIYLKYVGLGSWLPDVPARDLTKQEAEYYGTGRLVDSRLYEYANVTDNPKYKKTMRDVRDEIANKNIDDEQEYPNEPKKQTKKGEK